MCATLEKCARSVVRQPFINVALDRREHGNVRLRTSCWLASSHYGGLHRRWNGQAKGSLVPSIVERDPVALRSGPELLADFTEGMLKDGAKLPFVAEVISVMWPRL